MVPPSFYQPSRAQELPPEVLDIILSCFLDTKQTLASCSLVCKHWLSNARRYLFRTITIRLQDGWTNQEILHFLTNSPDRRWIKNIVIRGWWSRPLKLSFLAACLSELPTKLQTLSLVDLALHSYESQSECLGNPPAIEVETLELSQMDTPAIRVIETLSIFSEIETLVIHGGSDWARRFPEGRGVPMGRPFSLGSPSDDMGIIEQRTIRGLRAGRGCSLSYMRYLHGVLREHCSSTSFTTLDLPILSKNALSSAHDWLVDENERLTGLSLEFSSDRIAEITASNHIPSEYASANSGRGSLFTSTLL